MATVPYRLGRVQHAAARRASSPRPPTRRPARRSRRVLRLRVGVTDGARDMITSKSVAAGACQTLNQAMCPIRTYNLPSAMQQVHH
jgi:hypothetical protein